MSNAFAKVRKNATGTETATKGKPTAKVDASITDLHEFAALKYAQKTIETTLETLKDSVNEQAFDRFVEVRDPKSFKASEEHTNGSLQLRRRTSRSTFVENSPTYDLLTENDIDVELAETSHFYIKKEAAADDSQMEAIAAALEAAGINIDDVFGHTGDKYVVGKECLSQAMKINDEDTRRAVLSECGTQATRVTFGGSHDEMLEILDEVLKG